MSIQEHYEQVIKKFPDAPDRYELTVKEVYTNLLLPGDTAIDMGAHTGKHALPMGRCVGPSGRIYAFEPITEKFNALIANIFSSHLVQVSALNACCLDQNKIVKFTYLPSDPGKSAIHIRKALETSDIERRHIHLLAVKPDDFLKDIERLTFIKIDIEGAELSALEGTINLIKAHRPVAHVEIGPPSLEAFGADPRKIFWYFDNIGYNLYDILGGHLDSEHKYIQSVDARGVYDYLAIPSEHPACHRLVRACKEMWDL